MENKFDKWDFYTILIYVGGSLFLSLFVWGVYRQIKANDLKFQKDIIEYQNNAQEFCLKEFGNYRIENLPSKCSKFFK